MSTLTIGGLLLIAVPLAFNAAFATLAARFDCPDIRRQPTADVLAKFRAGGTPLVLTWWAFALTAVLMVSLVVLLARYRRRRSHAARGRNDGRRCSPTSRSALQCSSTRPIVANGARQVATALGAAS
jgi:membrane protein implicated in regulation of membrane protease activity